MLLSCSKCRGTAMIPCDKDYGVDDKNLCVECTAEKISEIKSAIIKSNNETEKERLLNEIEVHQERLTKMEEFYSDNPGIMRPSEM